MLKRQVDDRADRAILHQITDMVVDIAASATLAPTSPVPATRASTTGTVATRNDVKRGSSVDQISRVGGKRKAYPAIEESLVGGEAAAVGSGARQMSDGATNANNDGGGRDDSTGGGGGASPIIEEERGNVEHSGQGSDLCHSRNTSCAEAGNGERGAKREQKR